MVVNPGMHESELSYPPQLALDRIANMSILDTQYERRQLLEKIANKWTILLIYALT
jgi:hypothetical protein